MAPGREGKCGNVHSILPFQGNETHHQGGPGWGGQWERLFLPTAAAACISGSLSPCAIPALPLPNDLKIPSHLLAAMSLLVRGDHGNTNTAVLFSERNEVISGDLQQCPPPSTAQAQESKGIPASHGHHQSLPENALYGAQKHTRSPFEIFSKRDH